MSYGKLLSILALLIVFSAAKPAYAAVIVQQLGDTTNIRSSAQAVVVTLGASGTGLSSRLGSVDIKLDGVAVTRWYIACYLNSNFTNETCPEGEPTPAYATSTAGIATYSLDYSSSNYTFDPTHYYVLGLLQNVSGTTDIRGVTSPDWEPFGIYAGSIYFIAYDQNGPITDTSTHFDTVSPAGNSTIATSSTATFGATGYINPADFTSGMYVQIKYAPYSSMQASVANPDSLFTTLQFPITSSGSFSFSSSSPALTVGQYTMQTDIRSPSYVNNFLNFFGFGQFAGYGIKTATSTTFTAAHFSGYDTYVASTTALISDYLASSTISLASCSSWTSFNLGDCLNLMFVPQAQPIQDALGNFKNGFLSYAPWGYLTRLLVIFSGQATTSLPSFTTTIQLGSPSDTDTFTFDMQDTISGGGDLLNSIHANGSSMNIQDVIEPWIQLFIAMFVVIIIARDLTKMEHRGAHNFGHNGRE